VTFPVLIPVGSWRLQPHPLFEALAYVVGFLAYLWLRKRRGDPLESGVRWWLVIAAFAGAAAGSRLLALLDPPFSIGGRTVVGGLIGGLVAVELTKRRLRVHTRTGDLFAMPLAIGIAIGRIGCFLAGLPDHTYGNPTSLWTGVDFGDGVRRHPTQLYEIAFLILLIPVLKRVGDSTTRAGDQFRAFMIAYLGFRLAVDNLKPDPAVALGLSSIQWACVAMLAYYARDLLRPGAMAV
jgi:phosphatidylglycerol---prolipoprotein diacylglyceryl transferase